MIKEELYIIVDNEQRRIDLNTPSGITLEFKSNLFGDLSKIEASHSYTFQLPLTQNNIAAFDNICDIRSGVIPKKVEAIYLINGINVTGKTWLHVTEVGESISAVFDWGVIDGLKEIQENDISIRELGTLREQGGPDYEYFVREDLPVESDDVCLVFDSNASDLIGWLDLYEQYTGQEYVIYPVHTCGLPDSPKPNKFVRPNLAVDEVIRDNEDDRIEPPYKPRDRMTFFPNALPCVPVNTLLSRIALRYGLNLRLGDTFKPYVVPLVKREETSALVWENYAVITPRLFGLLGAESDTLQTYLLLYTQNDTPSIDVNGNEHTPYNVLYTDAEGHADVHNVGVESISSWILCAYSPFYRDYGTLCKLQLKAGLRVRFVCETLGDMDAPDIKFLVRNSEGYGEPDDGSGVEWNNSQKRATFYEVSRFSFELAGWDTEPCMIGLAWGLRHTFVYELNSDPVTGGEILETSWFLMRHLHFAISGFPESLVRGDGTPPEKEMTLTGTFSIAFSYGEYGGGCSKTQHAVFANTGGKFKPSNTNILHNLPDISCVEFLKNMFFVAGGAPVIRYENGNPVMDLMKYDKLYYNMYSNTRVALDWSNKIVFEKDERESKMSLDVTSATSSVGQTNYYLMKNDEVSSDGTEKGNELLEDIYKHCYLNFTLDNGILPRFATIFQSAFYGAFIAPKKYPDHLTGENQDYYIQTSYNTWEAREAKPMLGKVKPFATRNGVFIDLDIWDFSKSESYSYVSAIFGNYRCVEERMELSEYDLQTLDYEKPIYLAKYDSYFAIASIQYSTSDGLCVAKLVYLPPMADTPVPPPPLPPVPEFTGISIDPVSVTLQVGQIVHFDIYAHYDDGSQENVTSQCSVSTSIIDYHALYSTQDGTIIGQTEGTDTVKYSYIFEGHRYEVTQYVTITAAEQS